MATIEKKKILLVDDVQLFLEQEKSFLDREDFEILYAHSGAEAIRIAGEARPDLILMDFYMPDMNGDRCCRFLKESPALCEIPVVMVTAGGHEHDFKLAWQAGCDDIVVKPINGNYLRAVVKKYLPVVERQAPRYIARLQVFYRLDPDTLLDDYSINVSTGGLFLETGKVLDVGAPLALSFQLPDQQTPINCTAKVAWVNHPELIKVAALPAGMGIQFVDLTLQNLEAIRDFVRNGALLPYW